MITNKLKDLATKIENIVSEINTLADIELCKEGKKLKEDFQKIEYENTKFNNENSEYKNNIDYLKEENKRLDIENNLMEYNLKTLKYNRQLKEDIAKLKIQNRYLNSKIDKWKTYVVEAKKYLINSSKDNDYRDNDYKNKDFIYKIGNAIEEDHMILDFEEFEYEDKTYIVSTLEGMIYDKKNFEIIGKWDYLNGCPYMY